MRCEFCVFHLEPLQPTQGGDQKWPEVLLIGHQPKIIQEWLSVNTTFDFYFL